MVHCLEKTIGLIYQPFLNIHFRLNSKVPFPVVDIMVFKDLFFIYCKFFVSSSVHNTTFFVTQKKKKNYILHIIQHHFENFAPLFLANQQNP